MNEMGYPAVDHEISQILIGGDLNKLSAAQRDEYYQAVCKSLGLNPLTKPFEYLNLNGKLRLYALRDCTDQLRRVHGISIFIANRERISDIYVVTARAKDRTGREDESTGAVTIDGLKGDALANALMKAETKSKRRVTLSIAGLGWLDETELATIPNTGSGQPHSGPAVGHDGLKGDPATTHPSATEIDSLVELSLSVDEPRDVFASTIRGYLNLDDSVKITKKFLRETLVMTQFKEIWQDYADRLKKIVEDEVVADDVPTEFPEVTATTDPALQARLDGNPPEAERTLGAVMQEIMTVVTSLVRADGPTGQQDARDLLRHCFGFETYGEIRDDYMHEGVSLESLERGLVTLKGMTGEPPGGLSSPEMPRTDAEGHVLADEIKGLRALAKTQQRTAAFAKLIEPFPQPDGYPLMTADDFMEIRTNLLQPTT